ncbi:MAG: hypothetical protein WAM91_08615 [Candidatus Acidiferrales bacterium]
MRRTAIIIVCLAVLLIAAAAYYTWRQSSNVNGPAAGPEPSLVSQLPPGAAYVLYADIAALRNAAFLAKLAAMIPAPAEDPEYTDFVRATGFDYSRDLDRVAITSVSTTSISGTSQSEVWALAEGRFDQQKIQAYALRSGKTEQRDGQTVYVIDSGPSANEVELQFLSPTRIKIISRAKQIPPGNSTQNSGAAPAMGDPAALRERIARVSASPVFAVARTDSVPKNLTVGSLRLDAVVSTIQTVHWISLAVTPEGENLRVVLEGECNSTIESTRLDLALGTIRIIGRGMLSEPATRRQFTPQGAAALDKLVRQLDISHDGPHVTITAVLSPDMLTGFAAPTPNTAPNSAPNRAPNGAPAPKRVPAAH